MKKTTFIVIVIVLSSLFCNSKPKAADTEEWIRKPFHFNISYSLSRHFYPDLGDEDEPDHFLAHGGQIAFDWQGKGRLGVQVPVAYYFHPDDFDDFIHELNLGTNLMIHINKRDRAFDPYFAVGLKWIIWTEGKNPRQEWDGIALPWLNTGVGARYMVTPSVGLFGEAAASNLYFIVWQFEGKIGVSIGF